MILNIDGELISDDQLSLKWNNRAFLYGDGVFESIRVWEGKLMLWEDHYFRLMSSMRIARISIPDNFTPEYLAECMHDCCAANELENARLRISVFREGGGRYLPVETEVRFLIEVSPLDEALYGLNEQGLEVELYQDQFKMSGVHANIKTVSSQLYVMAAIFATENGWDDALLINESKSIVEGSSSNIFLIQGDEVITPALTEGCVRGVMRKNLIDLFQKEGVKVREERVSPFELVKADELWLTNAIKGIQWVGKYRKKTYQSDKAAEWSLRLRDYINSKEDLWEN
jgi:branched-chain amino acid aminotransferase